MFYKQQRSRLFIHHTVLYKQSAELRKPGAERIEAAS